MSDGHDLVLGWELHSITESTLWNCDFWVNTNLSLWNGSGTHSTTGYSGDQLSWCATLNGEQRQPTGKVQQRSSEYRLPGRRSG